MLLDALDALAQHREAVIVAGAQAVYLHTGDAGLSVAPYTTDGDVALNPAVLGQLPELSRTMTDAGFVHASRGEPGVWIASAEVRGEHVGIPVDLIVPETVASPAGRRSARLAGHDKRAARKVPGLEAALIDNAWTTIGSLSSQDRRVLESRVAGPTALLIAKAHKINDRLQEGVRPDRLNNKDALDVYRLMQTTPIDTVRAVLPELLRDKRSEPATTAGLALVTTLFGGRNSRGVQMAVQSLDRSVPQARVEAICGGFVAQLEETGR